MPYGRVRPGATHGAWSEYKAGDVVEVTADELISFADKLEKVQEPPYPGPGSIANGAPNLPRITAKVNNRAVPDISRLRMNDALRLITETKVLTVAEAISVETNASRPRIKMLEQLMVLSSQGYE